MSCYLTSGPRRDGNRGLGPAGAARGRRNPEREEFFPFASLLSHPRRGPKTTPQTTTRQARKGPTSSAQAPLPQRWGRPGRGSEDLGEVGDDAFFPGHWAVTEEAATLTSLLQARAGFPDPPAPFAPQIYFPRFSVSLPWF